MAIDAEMFKKLLSASTDHVERSAEAINMLNVFPVPDGDTGSNMLWTLRSGLQSVPSDGSVGVIARAVADGALMGARGCSGLLLSQFLGGFAMALEGEEAVSEAGLARALQKGADHAYETLREPVEGTILTVARAAASGAGKKLDEGADVVGLLEGALEEARSCLARTPDLLPVLAEAGVVDSGGQGLVCFLEGALWALKGGPAPPVPESKSPVGGRDEIMGYRYCLDIVLSGEGMAPRVLEEDLLPRNAEVMVVGDPNLIKIHLHTNSPDQVVERCSAEGAPVRVHMDDMEAQIQREQNGRAVGVVAVAQGEGMMRLFESLGARVVAGPNPSIAEITQAVKLCPAKFVVVLPNERGSVPIAEKAAELAGRPAWVAPSRSMPEGVAVALAAGGAPGAEQARAVAEDALNKTKTAVVAEARRAVPGADPPINEGDVVIMRGREAVKAGPGIEGAVVEAARALLGAASARESLLTLYYGGKINVALAEKVKERLEGAFPGLEVELYYGGQPNAEFLIGLE